MNYSERYLQSQTDSIAKWPDFLNKHSKSTFKGIECPDSFLKQFMAMGFTRPESERIFIGMMQFFCEALVIFEEGLMFSQRLLKSSPSWVELSQKTYHLFCKEEFYHSKAFRHYLNLDQGMTYPSQSLVLRKARWLKNAMAWTIRKEPLSIILPGLKSETFSLYLHNYLKELFASQDNTLMELHRLHYQDEAFHVSVIHELVQTYFLQKGFFRKLKFVFFNFIMIFLVQFIVIISYKNLSRQVFPKGGAMKRFIFIAKMFSWTLWQFPPYQQTKKNLKRYYKSKKDFYFRLIGAVSSL